MLSKNSIKTPRTQIHRLWGANKPRFKRREQNGGRESAQNSANDQNWERWTMCGQDTTGRVEQTFTRVNNLKSGNRYNKNDLSDIYRVIKLLHPNHRLIFPIYGHNCPIAHQKMAQKHTTMQNQWQIIDLFLHLIKDNLCPVLYFCIFEKISTKILNNLWKKFNFFLWKNYPFKLCSEYSL